MAEPAAPPPRDPLSQPVVAPEVRIGRTRRDGIAPSIFALIERGVHLRPHVARELRGKVVLRFHESYPAVRMSFGTSVIRVEDGDLRRPDLAVAGRLPDIVLMTTARLRMGMPDPTDARGRAALSRIALGRIRLTGDQRLARGLLELLRVDVPRGVRRGLVASEPATRAERPGAGAAAAWIDVLT
jgi:hypothetical protein